MFDPGDGKTDAQRAVGLIRDGVDELLEADLTLLSDEQLLATARELEVERRRAAAVDATVIAEIDARGLAFTSSCPSTATFVSNLLRIDPVEASARVKAAGELATRHTVTGQLVPPVFETVAAALRTGDISPTHARVITKTIDELPEDVQAERGIEIETDLVAEARRFRPRELRIICRRLVDTYDQDGRLASDADRERRRSLNYRSHADGSVTGDFRFEPVTGEAFLTAMASQLAGVTEEQRAKRTPAQLRHDALRDLLLMIIRSGTLPATGGVVATILLTMTPEQLDELGGRRYGADQTSMSDHTDAVNANTTVASASHPSAGHTSTPGLRREERARTHGDRLVPTGNGALISLEALRPLLGDAQILPVVLSRTRKIESYGDKHRIFTENQRLAMAARDLGCSFPGCATGPAWTEAHHVVPWSEGGASTVDNGTLLCPSHHRHHDDNGWQCVMREGIPHWIPPAWIDPDRRPQRNSVHHVGLAPETPPPD